MSKKLIEVDAQAFDDLMYLLDLCSEKGHLENCADLVDPWAIFDAKGWRVVEAAQPADGEPVATWVALTAAGQLRKGDKIRFRFGQETLTETVDLVLDAGTEREEIVYNRKRNFYFITSKALAGTSSAKEVEVLRTVVAPPAAAHGDEAVRKDAKRYRWLSKRDRWASTHCDFDRGGVYLRHRVVWFEPGEWKHSEGQTLDEAIDAAMRAQGDGEVQ